MAIRRGIITRDQGKEIIKKHDGKFPESYLGKYYWTILDDIGITVDEWTKIIDRYCINHAGFQDFDNFVSEERSISKGQTIQ